MGARISKSSLPTGALVVSLVSAAASGASSVGVSAVLVELPLIIPAPPPLVLMLPPLMSTVVPEPPLLRPVDPPAGAPLEFVVPLAWVDVLCEEVVDV